MLSHFDDFKSRILEGSAAAAVDFLLCKQFCVLCHGSFHFSDSARFFIEINNTDFSFLRAWVVLSIDRHAIAQGTTLMLCGQSSSIGNHRQACCGDP
jgi:hypothetical protein